MVRDVIHRIDDVKNMCEKRCQNLRRLTEKPVRPVQPVAPEQVAPPARSHKHHNTDRKRKRMNHREGSTEKVSGRIKGTVHYFTSGVHDVESCLVYLHTDS